MLNYDIEDHCSVLVREKPFALGSERFFFQESDARAGCAGPTRGSAENNSRVMLARSASDPFLADHDLTRPVSLHYLLTRTDP